MLLINVHLTQLESSVIVVVFFVAVVVYVDFVVAVYAVSMFLFILCLVLINKCFSMLCARLFLCQTQLQLD